MVELVSKKRKVKVSLSPTEHLSACYGMLDILYAFCYEARWGHVGIYTGAIFLPPYQYLSEAFFLVLGF